MKSGQSEHMKSSQSEQKGPTGGKSERGQDMQGQKSKSMSSDSDRARGGMKAEGREDRSGMKAEGREDRKGMKAEGREDRKGMKAEGREDRKGMKAEGRDYRDGTRNVETREGRDRNFETREGRGGSIDSRGSAESRSQVTTGQAGGSARLSTEQRTRITSVIRQQHVAPVQNVNFSIAVGTRVPREVRFHRLPSQIVTIYPQWRGYEYFLVRDQIVVVDPRTLEIVAVLDA
ncbi:MAG TPA: DUF1236 domain-containing protein [Bradyrhizobium sp.]|nr:DUF1236 domain-containing protein [Bradyrhizobium sp.]